MVHLVWIGGTGVLQSILSSLILKVYHAFAFKPITIKFGKFTNFWMLFQMTCSIFNSIETEYSYQEKICSYPVPCSFRTWPIRLTRVPGSPFVLLEKPWEPDKRPLLEEILTVFNIRYLPEYYLSSEVVSNSIKVLLIVHDFTKRFVKYLVF